jgi:hypothetical protein
MTTGSQTAAARAAFLTNPAIYAAEYALNGSYQDYDALQLELRRQFRQGIMGQINYTYSKTRSDAVGADSQSRIEPYLDNRRPQLDDGPSIYNIAHVINANAILELPFGQGKPWLTAAVSWIPWWVAGSSRRSSNGRLERRSASSRTAARSIGPGARAGRPR